MGETERLPEMSLKKLAQTALVVIAFGPGPARICAQSPREDKDPLTFEVASVKPSVGCPPACGLIRSTVGSQGYHVEGAFLKVIMTVAYSVTDRQISGGPSWITTERFDIEAKSARPRTVDELHIMLAHLLEERFDLEVRHETRQESGWNLVVASGGSKMPVHNPEDKDYPPMGPQFVADKDGAVCATLQGRNQTMKYLAFVLSRSMDRGVIDETGLPARYDVNLRYMPDGVHPRRPDGAEVPFSSDCSDIFSALPKQLGLKLEAAKIPVEFLVVEHVQKPTEN
jgi:uncharacterized protein (TIGR03435 family)